MLATKLKSISCKNPLRHSTDPDEGRTHNRMAVRVANLGDGRRRLIQRPAGRFVTARDATEEHPVAFELQQVVVSMHAAENLPHSCYHSRAKAIVLPKRAGLGGGRRF
jgi:hypothetical protein